jgi:hypothetical protein
MTPYRLLEQLLAWEQRVRQVYVTLSQQQQFPVDLRAVWKALAEDETHHIVALERSAHLFSVMDVPPSIPGHVLAEVEATIAAAETVVQQPNVTSDDAFRQALSLEGSELNRIDAAWLHGFRSTTSLLLHTQLPETPQHIRRLVDAVHQFSRDEALSAQADTLWTGYEKAK